MCESLGNVNLFVYESLVNVNLFGLVSYIHVKIIRNLLM